MTEIDDTCRCLCAQCTQEPAPYPVIGLWAPDAYFALGPRARRAAELSDLWCVIDGPAGTTHHLCTWIDVPITDRPGTALTYAPWVRVDGADFDRVLEHWDDPLFRETFVGELSGPIPTYPDEPTTVRLRTDGLTTARFLPGAGGALARDAARGITHAEAELRIRTILLCEDDV